MATATNPDIFQNDYYFPPFRELGIDDGLNLRYWRQSNDGVYDYAYTWCFLGEITNDECSQISGLMSRNRVYVRDRSGQDNIPVAFHPEWGRFDFKTLKKGHTLCVMQAQQHYFLDMTIGLRIENLDTVKVIPCGLDDLFSLSKVYFQCPDVCWGCNKKESEVTAKLKKCSACKVARYCDKQCQGKDWKERHRVWCKLMPEFVKMAKIDYSHYSKDAIIGLFGRIW